MATSRNTHDLDLKRLPRHVAIIMDGNGRWAQKQGVSRLKGHEAGAKAVRAVIEACRELGKIESLTLYAFSTENWRRSKMEVSGLFRLLSKYIRLELDNLHAEDIRVGFIGHTDGLSKRILDDMETCRERTRENRSMLVNFAVNYGARGEIADACRAIAQEVKSGKRSLKSIDADCVADHLYDSTSRDLDLLIRSGGDSRVSNFMLWQVSYAEIVVTKTLWPDFRKRHLYQTLREFQSRTRRFGGRPK